MRWIGHVAHMEMRYAYKISQNLKEGDSSGYLGVDGKIILKWILKTQDMRVWTRLTWISIGSVVVVTERNLRVLRKYREHRNQTREHQLIIKTLFSLSLFYAHRAKKA
jgi:hypothetical protein